MTRSSRWYPDVEDVRRIHEDIVEEYPDTSAGVRNEGAIEFAVEHVERNVGRSGPATIHDEAATLLRLLVANHPFVDGNKRTALNVTSVFYALNGYRFAYDDDVRSLLKSIATDERDVDETGLREYLEDHTDTIELESIVDQWRDDLIEYGLDQLDDRTDRNN